MVLIYIIFEVAESCFQGKCLNVWGTRERKQPRFACKQETPDCKHYYGRGWLDGANQLFIVIVRSIRGVPSV